MGHEGMKASLVSREVIADSIEIMMRAHRYDALVGISAGGKSLPGQLWLWLDSMFRPYLSTARVYCTGTWNGKPSYIIQDVYEVM